jgi:hypothetical protein
MSSRKQTGSPQCCSVKTFFTGLRIMVEIAAPKHQEMNGIVEAAWRAIRLLAARAL